MSSFKAFALGAVLSASPTLCFATPVTPGGATVTPSALAPIQVGNILTSAGGTITAATFTGSYTVDVIHDSTNPYNAQCSGGCLTFEITFTNNGPTHVENLTDGDGTNPSAGDGFESFSDNVGYIAGTGSVIPISADENADGVIAFNFTGAGAIPASGSTDTLVIQTSASNYTTGLFSAIDSSSGTNTGWIPAASTTGVTPEPAGIVLLGTGLLGMAGLAKQRFRQGARR